MELAYRLLVADAEREVEILRGRAVDTRGLLVLKSAYHGIDRGTDSDRQQNPSNPYTHPSGLATASTTTTATRAPRCGRHGHFLRIEATTVALAVAANVRPALKPCAT